VVNLLLEEEKLVGLLEEIVISRMMEEMVVYIL
jgi:hypothetical protein